MTSSTTLTTTLHEDYADPNTLRTSFTLSLSAMYKAEVPLYGTLMDIVSHVNQITPNSDTAPAPRIDIERHGAIRLGTRHELRTMARLFRIIGLHPVGYYDLSPAGLPMHATCFRPLTSSALHQNPFRVFTSVLRPELLHDTHAKALAADLLSKRAIFTPQLLALLDEADAQQGRLTVSQGEAFISTALHTFKWHGTAASSHQDYMRLKAEHPILADMACFRTAHINHLTPRTLDIVSAQEAMKKRGLAVKQRIEGPPARACPILLRQTSFLAIEEPVKFVTMADVPVQGSHRARFGEIEERGAAVTPAGRALYDELLDEAMYHAQQDSLSPDVLDEQVQRAFTKYPDKWDELRRSELVYFTYVPRQPSGIVAGEAYILDRLVEEGIVDAVPITYEDFLPLSAAGIFQSNIGNAAAERLDAVSDMAGLEAALGCKLHNSDDLYRRMRDDSVAECAKKLSIAIRHGHVLHRAGH